MSLTIDLPGQPTLALSTQGVTVVYGHSGAGKTTLLRAIAGLDHYPGATIRFKGQIWQAAKQFVPVHQRALGYVFQDSRLFPHLNVQQNLMYGLKRVGSRSSVASVEEVVEGTGIQALLEQPVQQLSGGERQRVALARALLSAPRLLLLDEPMASLDERAKRQLLGFLKTYQQRTGLPMLYITHSRMELECLANRLLLLSQQKVVAEGPWFDLISRLDLPLAHEEEAASVIEARIGVQDHQYALTELKVGEQQLWVSQIDAPEKQAVRVRLMARDISLCLIEPQASSILNSLKVRVVQIENSHEARVLVKLHLLCQERCQEHGQEFLARITRRSLDSLKLVVGQQVYAQIKSVGLMTEVSVCNNL